MRKRIPYQTLSEKIAGKKRELAILIATEYKCSMTRAYKKIEFNLSYKSIA